MVEQIVNEFISLTQDEKVPYAVAAIRCLHSFVKSSSSPTFADLNLEIEQQSEYLICYAKSEPSVKSCCNLFKRLLSRSISNSSEADFKKSILQISDQALRAFDGSRSRISKNLVDFIHKGCIIMTFGYSRVVTQCLVDAAMRGVPFTLYNVDSPGSDNLSEQLSTFSHVFVKDIPFSDVGSYLHKAHFVLVGAQAVSASGGIINRAGTFQIAVLCKHFCVPFYVCAELYKLIEDFYLSQEDLPKFISEFSEDNRSLRSDFTPRQFVNMIFTDSGAMTTAAVSEELIKMYA